MNFLYRSKSIPSNSRDVYNGLISSPETVMNFLLSKKPDTLNNVIFIILQN